MEQKPKYYIKAPYNDATEQKHPGSHVARVKVVADWLAANGYEVISPAPKNKREAKRIREEALSCRNFRPYLLALDMRLIADADVVYFAYGWRDDPELVLLHALLQYYGVCVDYEC